MVGVRLGTSGWSYKEWIGPFYPDKETKMLSHYSQVFTTAEIDSTFYAYPSRGTVYGWLRHTPKDFVFSAKLPRIITHEKKLDMKQRVKADLNKFAELMEPLQRAGKLFALLIQLPPGLKQDLDLLKHFLEVLLEEYQYAIEFRHKTWWNEGTWKLLRQYNIANTIVDEPLLPPEPVVTADFAYIRWHGRGRKPWYNYRYSIDELRPWIPRIKEVAEKTKATYGYFNNHYHGYAVENCLQVLEMLGVSTPQQVEARRVAEQYINSRVVEVKVSETPTSLQIHEETIQDISVRRMLSSFMDIGRLRRALEIRDDELSFEEEKSNLVRARIREYVVVIDHEKKTILHDCADWAKRVPEKAFCKHVGKVFMSLPEAEAKRVLNEIYSGKDSWKFLPAS